MVNKTVPHTTDSKFFLQVIDGQRVWQLGNAVKGGQEVAIHAINALVHEQGKGRASLPNDGRNAYNSVDRVFSVNATMEEFESTARWTRWYYGTAAIINHGDSSFFAGEGAYQGCPLGGRIHDTGTQKVLINTAHINALEHPDKPVDLVAYRDDINIVGEPEHALRVHTLLNTTRRETLGVEPSPEKDEAYCPRSGFADNESHERALTLLRATFPGLNKLGQPRASSAGLALLGSAIGSEEFVAGHLTRATHKHPDFLPRLAKMERGCALPLLRQTYLPIATNLARATHPDLLRLPARAFDTSIHECYCTIMDDKMLDRDDSDFSLPFKEGGSAFRSVEKTSPIAYFASLVQAAYTLKGVDAHVTAALTHHLIPPTENAPHHHSTTVGIPCLPSEAWTVAHLTTFNGHPNSLFPPTLPDLFHRLATGEIAPKRLQHLLTELVEKSRAAELMAHRNPEDAARINALKVSGSSFVLSTVPDHTSVALPAPTIAIIAKIRTGTLQIPERVCCCGLHTTTLSHILTCKRLRSRFIRHDIVVEVLRLLMHQAGYVVRKEVFIIDGTQKRMDLVVTTANKDFWIDVRIVNPLAASNIAKADPLKDGEIEKDNKYGAEARARGFVMIPFVVNAFGGLGKKALEVVQMIAAKALLNTPCPNISNPTRWTALYRHMVVHRVTSALAHAVGVSIDEALIRAQGKSMHAMYRRMFSVARRITV
jgi:hypothetical protein